MIVWDSPVMDLILSDEPEPARFPLGAQSKINKHAIDLNLCKSDAKHDEAVEARLRGWKPCSGGDSPG